MDTKDVFIMKFGYTYRFISQDAENTWQVFHFAFPANSNVVETSDYLPASAYRKQES